MARHAARRTRDDHDAVVRRQLPDDGLVVRDGEPGKQVDGPVSAVDVLGTEGCD